MSRLFIISRASLLGLAAMLVLLGTYVSVLTAVSGSGFALSQFAEFWYFIVSLALGFGIQVAFSATSKARFVATVVPARSLRFQDRLQPPP